MKLKAYSKINLGLNVYKDTIENSNKHLIETIMFQVQDLYDEIEIVENSTNKVFYKVDEIETIFNNCLILKTLNYLQSKGIIKKSYLIYVNKKIPLASGLGGGSSNAGTVIRGVLDLEQKNISELDMFEIANELGSDIPFFVYNYKTAYVSNIGDQVEPLNFNTNLEIKLIMNNEQISTNNIFDAFLNSSETTQKTDFAKLIDDLNAGNKIENVYNSLQTICFELNENLAEKYNNLKSQFDFLLINGSGSSFIAINNPKIRTRYAPSPTGYFHIGGARTAIFNYLFAKHNNGKFIVRIEDTDVERNVDGGIESQLNNLKWLNTQPDESILNEGQYGPYIQSAKLEKYEALAEQLVKEKKAYYCFCSKELLDQQRAEALANHQTPKYQRNCLHLTEEEIKAKLAENIPYVIRLKIDDDKHYAWNDLIRGRISVPGSALTDPVILKANKIAMYNFAVVVDDYDMKITHVLRGEEHISNTPYQLAIAKALNKTQTIKYGHLSIIVDETGKKLSKRNEALKQFIEDYQSIGVIPEALFNFLTLLGWSSKTNNEILSQEEIIEEFDLNRISKSPAFFDDKKLWWLSNEYFKKMDNNDYLVFVKPFIQQKYLTMSEIDEILLLFKSQISAASEINALIELYFFNASSKEIYDNIDFLIDNIDVIETFKKELISINEWNDEQINGIIKSTKKTTNKSGKNLFMTIRLATTKLQHGAELVKMLKLLGKENIERNIEECLEIMKGVN